MLRSEFRRRIVIKSHRARLRYLRVLARYPGARGPVCLMEKWGQHRDKGDKLSHGGSGGYRARTIPSVGFVAGTVMDVVPNLVGGKGNSSRRAHVRAQPEPGSSALCSASAKRSNPQERLNKRLQTKDSQTQKHRKRSGICNASS